METSRITKWSEACQKFDFFFLQKSLLFSNNKYLQPKKKKKKKKSSNFCLVYQTTIIFIIFWDFLMFYQIFLSPQVKRCAIITCKSGIYELPYELLNDLRLQDLRKLGKIGKVSKLYRMIPQCVVSPPKWKFC